MATDAYQNAQAFKTSVEDKIEKLITEFSEGKLSREQFHTIYERYNGQLSIATAALASASPDISEAQSGPPTIAIRDSLKGKAIGLLIYHNRSGTVLETLGDFDVPVTAISGVLNDFSLLMEENQIIERKVMKQAERRWLLFVAGRHTTIVTVFHNEPSEVQMRELERLHRDFENANHAVLSRERADTSKLAYPFLIFVRRKLK
jgi:hypothetical protein